MIGGGFAGLCARCDARNWGCDRLSSNPERTKTTFAARAGPGGTFHVSYHDVKLSPDKLLAAINRQTSRESDQ